MQQDDVFADDVLEAILGGMMQRRYGASRRCDVDAERFTIKGISKSSISRLFVKASTKAAEHFLTRYLVMYIDGAKALAADIRDVMGADSLIQRCTLHKKRNVLEHLPEDKHAAISADLSRIWAEPDVDAARTISMTWPVA